MKKLFRKIKNFFFCLKYPVWKFYRWDYSKRKYKLDYSTTWYESIPIGWRKAFGKQLSEELTKVAKEEFKRVRKEPLKYKEYKKNSLQRVISWSDIKEKYGELRLDCSCTTDKIQDVLNKYELLSIGYCIYCGKPARYKTGGWITFMCEDCFNNYLDGFGNEKIKLQCLEKDRLTKKDIPAIYSYHKGMNGKLIKKRINIKKKYGIDFKSLWDI